MGVFCILKDFHVNKHFISAGPITAWPAILSGPIQMLFSVPRVVFKARMAGNSLGVYSRPFRSISQKNKKEKLKVVAA